MVVEGCKEFGQHRDDGEEDKAMGTFCDTSEKGPFCHSLPAIVSAPAGQGQEASGATRQDIRERLP